MKQVDLLKYPVAVDKLDQPIRLLSDGTGEFFVAQTALRAANAESTAPDHTKTFVPEADEYRLQPGEQTLRIPLHRSDGSGLEVTKIYTFHRDSYAIDVEFEIKNGTDKVWQGTAYRQLQRSNPGKGSSFTNPTYTGAAVSSDEKKYEKISFDNMSEENLSRDIRQGWVAMMQHYFVSAWACSSSYRGFGTKRMELLGGLLKRTALEDQVCPFFVFGLTMKRLLERRASRRQKRSGDGGAGRGREGRR